MIKGIGAHPFNSWTRVNDYGGVAGDDAMKVYEHTSEEIHPIFFRLNVLLQE